MNKYTKTIRRISAWGLWGSVGLIILTVAFIYSPWRFTTTGYTARWMLVAGSVLAVMAVSMTLLAARRAVPQLRQAEGLEAKLQGYAAHVRSTFLTMLTVVLLLCLFTLISGNNVLLMLAIVCTLTLMLSFPNIYRVKADLGLSDAEMRTLYGDKYIGDAGQD